MSNDRYRELIQKVISTHFSLWNQLEGRDINESVFHDAHEILRNTAQEMDEIQKIWASENKK